MGAYYNENDAYAVKWLRELIRHGHIAPGDVDDRDIRNVNASDLTGFTQCHFFAGIGVWSYALRRAGWPDDRPVWTGSCPCQPFSGAGKRLGEADPRHLWPVWWPLIREHRPVTILGEQVSGAAGYGWWDAVCADLEGEAYAGAAADLAAASVGAPHIRQRLYWMAHRDGGLADTLRPGLPTREWEGVGGSWRGEERRAAQQCGGASGGVANTNGRHPGAEREQRGREHGQQPQDGGTGERPGPLAGQWADADWLGCTDGRWRPVEPDTFPLAHGIAGRVGRLRAYGNAICAPLAISFIESVMECM